MPDANNHAQSEAQPAGAQAASATEANRPQDVDRPDSVLSLPLATLTMADPFHWLKLGWLDFRRTPSIGLFYGLCFFSMGHALLELFHRAPAHSLSLSAGFLLVGPFLCLGLYDASRALQQPREQPTLRQSMLAWRPIKGSLAIFACLLLILEMLWGRASLVVFAVSFNTIPEEPSMLAMLLNTRNLGFVITYTLVGGVFASLIFVTSVISIPMIMDRKVDAVSAGLTSIRACLKNPGVMFLWGSMITVSVTLAMLPWFLGLLVVGPVIGHATWHAYRQTVVGTGKTDAG